MNNTYSETLVDTGYTDTLNCTSKIYPKYASMNLYAIDTAKLSIELLDKNHFYGTEVGLAFFIEERNDIFCNDLRSRVECKLVDFSQRDREPEWDNYKFIVLVSGFEMPKVNSPLWNHTFKAEKHARGEIENGNYRSVYLYVPDDLGLGVCVGITVHNTCGSFSGYPPHEFEVEALSAPLNTYPNFDEKFIYFFDKVGAWGLQGQNPRGKNFEVIPVRDCSTTSIPLGTHFCVAEPGTRMAYIWAYRGGGAKEYK